MVRNTFGCAQLGEFVVDKLPPLHLRWSCTVVSLFVSWCYFWSQATYWMCPIYWSEISLLWTHWTDLWWSGSRIIPPETVWEMVRLDPGAGVQYCVHVLKFAGKWQSLKFLLLSEVTLMFLWLRDKFFEVLMVEMAQSLLLVGVLWTWMIAGGNGFNCI